MAVMEGIAPSGIKNWYILGFSIRMKFFQKAVSDILLTSGSPMASLMGSSAGHISADLCKTDSLSLASLT